MSDLKIPPEKAILLLNGRIDAIKTLEAMQQDMGYYDMVRWCSGTWSAIDEIYPAADRHPEEIRLLGTPACSCSTPGDTRRLLEEYHTRLLEYIEEIGGSMNAGKK